MSKVIIHIIGTVNGVVNEGMRNVATHLSSEFAKGNTVLYSGLKQVPSIIKNSLKSDVTLIFARANKLIYFLTRIVELFCKHVWIVLVQKPDTEFMNNCSRHPLKCNYFSITADDMKDIPVAEGKRKELFPVGIKTEKFIPVDAGKAADLKRKYSFDPEKPLVIHVGHCSSGRGLEDFTLLDSEKYQSLVVASGMFEDETVVEKLTRAGVKIHKGFLENVEEIYQMADAYLFPTKSGDFVISIPLSVMEALACGIPVIGYESFTNLKEIAAAEGAIHLIQSPDEIEGAVKQAKKSNCSLLVNAHTWADSAAAVLKTVKEELE